MGQYLRKISKAKWDREASDGDVIPDALADFRTKDNKLSVYELQNDDHLERAIIAMFSACDRPENIDYAIVTSDFLQELNIVIEHTPGKTPDDEVNRWHRDLVIASGSQLLTTAQQFRIRFARIRVLEKKVRRSFMAAVESGVISIERVNEKLREKLSL